MTELSREKAGETAKESGMETPGETAARTSAMPAKRVPTHGGGQIFSGGVRGNAGGTGAPSSALRARLRGSVEERVRILEEIADDHSALKTDRIRALDVLARYGLGAASELTFESVRERLVRTIDVLHDELDVEDARRVLMRIAPIWRG